MSKKEEEKRQAQEQPEQPLKCPKCGKPMAKKETRTGKVFYECEECMRQFQPDFFKTSKPATQNRPYEFGFI